MSYATSIFWNSVKLRAADGIVVTFHIAICGVTTSALFLLATGTFALTSSGLAGWLPLLVTSFFFSMAFIGTYKAIELVGGAPTAMMLNLEPVFVMFLAALFLGEDLTLPRLVGGAMVIGAVVMSEAWRNRKAIAVEVPG